MAKKQVVSDKLAKAKCKEWLENNGFVNVRPPNKQSCDLIASKNDKDFFIEIKYSSKEGGGFFGTVMLTEIFQAITNKDIYLFLVCRGASDNINEWLFKLFSVDEFMKCCTLTTPIFLYHLYNKDNIELTIPNFTKSTKMATDSLINQMWEDFQRWKS